MGNTVRSLRSMRFTLFVCAVMVWGWGYFLFNNIEGFPFVFASLLPLIVAFPLLLLAIRFAVNLRGLSGPRLFTNGRVVLLYVIGVGTTVVGYVLANVIAQLLHHREYVVPGAILALGLHFLFLGLAFDEKREYLTLAVFCLTAIIVPVTVPQQFTLGSVTTLSNGGGWMVVASIVGLVWLWSVAVFLFIRGGRSLQQIKGTLEVAQA